MRNPRFMVQIILCLSAILSLSSCAIDMGAVSPLASSRSGFTTELDEPSARGQLSRISPEQSNVSYRFDLSPDGKYIIYSGVQAGGGNQLLQLWKISSDGSGSPIKITSGGDNNFFYPCFTQDGAYIVYESGNHLWRVRSDGAGGKMSIPGAGNKTDTAPHLSREDKLVFNSVQYTSSGGVITGKKYLIWTSDLNGGELTQIREGSNPRWAPDGKKIVFEHDGELWTIEADGTSLIQLTNTESVLEMLPSFSPDGSKIVYTSNEGKDGNPSFDWNIWTMKTDGSNRMQITELKSWDAWPIWSPNGIYFLSARAQSGNTHLQRIWKLKP